jgi:hypothetical protein
MASPSYSGLVNLPAEILIHIASYLTSQSDISRLCRTHRRTHFFLTDVLLEFNIKHQDGIALLWAVRNDHYRLTRRLVRLGADPLMEISGHSLLALALWRGDEPIIQFLLSRLPSVNIPITMENETALHIACAKRLANTIVYLLQAGADPNIVGKTKDRLSAFDELIKAERNSTGMLKQRLCDRTMNLLVIMLQFGDKPSASTCYRAQRHTDPRVRYLFSGSTYLPTDDSEALSLYRFQTRHQRKSTESKEIAATALIDETEFPALTLNGPSYGLELSDVWKGANVEYLLSKLIFVEQQPEADEEPVCQSPPINPFPVLTERKQYTNADAEKFWSDLKPAMKVKEPARKIEYSGDCKAEPSKSIVGSSKLLKTEPFPSLRSSPRPFDQTCTSVWASFKTNGERSEVNGIGSTLDFVPGPSNGKGKRADKSRKWKRLQL